VRITDVTTWVVNVPLVNPFTSSFETKAGTTRTVVRLRTDDGLEGWGETMSGQPVSALVERLTPQLVGYSAFDLEAMHQRLAMVPFFYGYHGYAAIAGLDVACWDLIGKASDQPLVNLLGGVVRERIGLTALVTRSDAGRANDADLPRAVGDRAAEVVGEYGFESVKLKGTVDASGDAAIMAAIRERLPGAGIRVDPNAAWSVHESVTAGRRMEPLELEYLEDPCPGLEGMRRVRQQVRIPLCTNMCVVRFDDVAPAARMDAVDIVHGDVFKWGGVRQTKNLAQHCDSFGLGMNMHSGGELGLSTAVHLAVVASTPQLSYAIDSMYYLLADDIATEPLVLTDGALSVPRDRPGIGVAIDEEKLERYAEANAVDGDITM